MAGFEHWEPFLPPNAVVMGRREKRLPTAPLQDELFLGTAHSPIPPDDSLDRIAQELTDCTRCKLCKSRKTIVLGEGNPSAELVFVGEGPGEQEDLQGRPFVGRSGQLLDRMIQAMGLERSSVFIANVVKCRPPNNRNPERDEIAQCGPFLRRQLEFIKPKVIIALGTFAAQTLLETTETIGRLRGRFHPYAHAKLLATFHPAYLLRNPPAKKDAWEDLKRAAQELNLTIPSGRV